MSLLLLNNQLFSNIINYYNQNSIYKYIMRIIFFVIMTQIFKHNLLSLLYTLYIIHTYICKSYILLLILNYTLLIFHKQCNYIIFITNKYMNELKFKNWKKILTNHLKKEETSLQLYVFEHVLLLQ